MCAASFGDEWSSSCAPAPSNLTQSHWASSSIFIISFRKRSWSQGLPLWGSPDQRTQGPQGCWTVFFLPAFSSPSFPTCLSAQNSLSPFLLNTPAPNFSFLLKALTKDLSVSHLSRFQSKAGHSPGDVYQVLTPQICPGPELGNGATGHQMWVPCPWVTWGWASRYRTQRPSDLMVLSFLAVTGKDKSMQSLLVYIRLQTVSGACGITMGLWSPISLQTPLSPCLQIPLSEAWASLSFPGRSFLLKLASPHLPVLKRL